ncbi:hypothetical protein LMG28140_03901 [Paraburkholderia metrosideri]|uniref:Uncharacterized protein n=1 Tax=Paraburkholderia metrosideri TaxID=580937 RepID=A0ABM8NTZ0_9BURK|nr:hypothetical protein LMG28140_03901 [Paraburkholderia metrosideri]
MNPNITGPAAVVSPYTAKNIDEALTHLERVLSVEGATTVLGRHYWHGRVAQIGATLGLTPRQRARVARLPQLLADAQSAQCEN